MREREGEREGNSECEGGRIKKGRKRATKTGEGERVRMKRYNSLTFLVCFLYLVNLGVGTGAKNLNETLFISSRPLHCPAETLGIVECLWFHETQDQLLQVAAKL